MTTIVTNKGDASIKLLDHPVSPLNGIQTDIFDVTRECGKRPQFIGYRVSHPCRSPFVMLTYPDRSTRRSPLQTILLSLIPEIRTW